jgi:antitoxin PrlF
MTVRNIATSTLTRKGQTTIPLKVRNHLKLRAGDKIEFVIQRDGKVMVVPKNVDIRELAGMLSPAPRRLTIEQMDEVIRSRFERS